MYSTMPTGRVVGIFFSSGDLGDVGRHAVAAALEMPPSVVSNIRVFSRDIASMDQANWKCGCGEHSISQEDRNRIQFLQIDCTQDDLVPALFDVDAIVSCLGSRQPFHNERIVREGTERLVQAAITCKIARFVMISSVGIGDDWPPMHVSKVTKLDNVECHGEANPPRRSTSVMSYVVSFVQLAAAPRLSCSDVWLDILSYHSGAKKGVN
jgi:nucleoside-diphosphate-sugar epimerase